MGVAVSECSVAKNHRHGSCRLAGDSSKISTRTQTAGTTMGVTINGISSMATRQVLAELAAAFEQTSGHRLAI